MAASGGNWRGILAGFLAGFAGGLFGVGGGIILVPLLTGVFGLTQHRAHGTSLAAIGATAIAGLAVYAWGGHVAWMIGAIMAVTSVLAARLGARLAARTSRAGLTRAFAVFLLIVAGRMLWRAWAHAAPAAAGGTPALAGVGGALAALAVGAGAGLVAGFMGVGGGILAVPALVLLFGASQQTAQGTSLALILVTAPMGAIEHHRHGNVVPGLVPFLAIGAVIGSPLASGLALRLPQSVLSLTFALFLVANAVVMWIRAARRA